MKRLLVYIALIVWCCGVNAQLLYEISGKGLSKPSFLFGTHSMVSAEALIDIPGVFRAFNDCSAVLCEFVEEDNEDSEKVQNKILNAAQMDLSLLDILDDEEEFLVDSALKAELGLSLVEMQNFRPNMLTMIYEMTVAEHEETENTSVESYFQVAGAELGKKVYGLESLEKQLFVFFQSKPIEQQAKQLVATIRKEGDFKKDFETVEKVYREGNLETLYQLILDMKNMTEAEKFLLVDERNREWVPTIEEYIKSEPCFISVTALHLPGKDGLINLLRKAGYKVKEVK